jgi:inosine/xanthosine triphosphatase
MIVVVASSNYLKVEAVREAMLALRKHAHGLQFMYDTANEMGIDDGEHWSDMKPTQLLNTPKRWRVQQVEVASGVAAQPFSEEETRRGALQRARAALQVNSQAQLAVGLEGGVSEQTEGLYSTVWVAVVDKNDRQVCVNGARFLLPKPLADAIRSGTEMGDAVDQLTGRVGIKHEEGMIGVMTQRLTSRVREYRELSYLALSLYFSQTYQL